MKKYRGLTLIEVLIASLLLFISLGLVATVFQYNLHTQSRLLSQLDAYDGFASIQSQISYALQQGEREGTVLLKSEEISWQATVLLTRLPITSMDFENNLQDTSAKEMQLLQIAVYISESRSPIEYKEFIW